MMSLKGIATGLVCLSLGFPALVCGQQFDVVVGKRGTPTYGTITEISPTRISIDTNSGTKLFQVNEIQKVSFKSEPRELRIARDAMLRGQLEAARSDLDKINVAEVSREAITQDIEFFKAFCDGRLALVGGGNKGAAVKALRAFEDNPANAQSYHHFAAMELLGDLAVGLSSFEHAIRYYGELGKAPWPDYQMRAAVLEANAMIANEVYPEALKKFEDVLASSVDDAAARQQKQVAILGRAVCLAHTGSPQEGIASVMQVISETDSGENPVLFAKAYNALGTCYLKDNKPQDALLAFLHVDLLFNQDPDAHAESLHHLYQLWPQVNKPERALRARSMLNNRYSGSRWADRK